MFRNHLGFSQNGHKVRVTKPAGYHMDMYVLLQPGARSPAHVDANVNAFGVELVGKQCRAYLHETKHIEKLFIR